MIALIRSLDLTFVVGNQVNVDELEGLLRITGNTDFTYHAPAQRLRFAHDPTSFANIADFLYYDPWRGQVITYEDYIALRTRGRPKMPAGHPTGFNWGQVVAGWDGQFYVHPEGAPPAVETGEHVAFLGVEQVRNSPYGLFRGVQGYSTRAYQGAYFGASDVHTALPEGTPVGYVQGTGVAPPAPGSGPALLCLGLRRMPRTMR